MNLPSILRWLLWPLSLVYGIAVRLRLWLYSRGTFETKRLRTPVISVGNLSVGGTGKTPMVIWLAERFLAAGKRVGVLSRGYKGSGDRSDEIELMRYRLNDRVLFGVGADRYEQGRRLEQQGVDVFLLDDGYQHLQLARDVNLLLMDAVQPLGREMLLPAGRLREPVSATGRASLLVFTRTETSASATAALGKLQEYPVFSAATRLLGFRRLGGGVQVLTLAEIGEGPFVAFCGIGNPRAFFLDLQNWQIPVVRAQAFPDHHRYTAGEAKALAQAARAADARAFVTTEKDAQNLGDVQFGERPVFVAVIDLVISQERAFWEAIQAQIVACAPSRRVN
ncbi:MAG TPA: tetraacyldisaccharide 4'-kinase [Candidatus Acidoferrum sp.]|nr:tetraacyldisaccharide 4'-kinase [Candidatus Acidoferrum sp.]